MLSIHIDKEKKKKKRKETPREQEIALGNPTYDRQNKFSRGDGIMNSWKSLRKQKKKTDGKSEVRIY